MFCAFGPENGQGGPPVGARGVVTSGSRFMGLIPLDAPFREGANGATGLAIRPGGTEKWGKRWEMHMLMGPEMPTGRMHMGPAPLQSLCLKLSRGVLTSNRACRTMRRWAGTPLAIWVFYGLPKWGGCAKGVGMLG